MAENDGLTAEQMAAKAAEEAAKKADSDLVEKLVKERLEENLKPIKDKLDKAFEARDAALKKAAEYEQEKKEAEIAKLKEDGKHKEAYEAQLAQERAAREAVEKRNVELTRDIEVRNALSSLDFRNDKAIDMAYLEIVKDLVRDGNGIWVHRSGVTIKDYVKTFVANEDNSFLFKIKPNSGGGGSGPKKESDISSNEGKSLYKMTQDEVLKLASEGKLPRQNR